MLPSTGPWCACTRLSCPPWTSSTAPTAASGNHGQHCSTATASTSWCAGTSTTMNSHTRSAAKPATTHSPDPGFHSHRHDRHHQGHRAHGHRRRQQVRAVQTRCSSHLLNAGSLPAWARSTPRSTNARPSTSPRTRPGRRSATPTNPYGFAAFDVDPDRLGGITSIHVTYYAASGHYGDLTPVDRFTLTRPRGGRDDG